LLVQVELYTFGPKMSTFIGEPANIRCDDMAVVWLTLCMPAVMSKGDAGVGPKLWGPHGDAGVGPCASVTCVLHACKH
jgi:hypothetical protein